MKMSTLATFALALGLLSAGTASAGDPCPIGYNVMDMGTVDGLDRTTVLKGLKSMQPRLGVRYRGKDGAVRITGTDKGSAAETAGLKDGDIIVTVQGQKITAQKDVDRAVDANLAIGKVLEFVVKRGDEKKTINVTPKAADPLLWALFRWGKKQDCADVDYADHSSDRGERAAAIRAATIKKGKLRCTGAHRRLAKVFKNDFEGEIVLVRGKSKVLLSMPGFKTMCVDAADYDGDKLTKKRVGKLFKRLTKAYTADRHSNP